MVALNDSLRRNPLSNAHQLEKIIRLYRANECLWNPRSPGYHNLALKANAWHRISLFFNDELSVDQLKSAIFSLRQLYRRERLNRKHNGRMDPYIAPRDIYLQNLQFLEEAEMENSEPNSNEPNSKLCNNEINDVADDTILMSNSENDINSEDVDFELPMSLDKGYFRIESLEFAENEKHPFPIEFQEKRHKIRSLSGNDEYDDSRREHSQPHSSTSRKYGIISQNTINYFNHGHTTQWPIAAVASASNPPRKKVLTGRYGRQNPSTVLRDGSRTTSGNDKRYASNGTYENINVPQEHNNRQNELTCSPGCTCCQSLAGNMQNRYQEDDDQVNTQLQLESEQNNYDEFRSPEPTSEDDPQVARKRCCCSNNCPVLLGRRPLTKYDYEHPKNESYVDQSVQPNTSRKGPSRSEETLEKEEQADSGWYETKQTSKKASRASQPVSGSDQKQVQPEASEWVPTDVYCTGYPNQIDNERFVECPTKRRERERHKTKSIPKEVTRALQPVNGTNQEEERQFSNQNSKWVPTDVYCTTYPNQIDNERFVKCPKKRLTRMRPKEKESVDVSEDRKNIPSAYQNEYNEDSSNRYAKSSPTHSRRVSDHYEYKEDRKLRKRQSDQNDEYYTYASNQYENYQNPGRAPRQRQADQTYQNYAPNQYETNRNTGRTPRRSSQKPNDRSGRYSTRGYMYDNMERNGDYGKTQDKYRQYNYDPQPEYRDPENDSCYCLSDENEIATQPAYADESVDELPQSYTDTTQANYADEYTEELRQGYAEETQRRYPTEYTKDNRNRDYPQQYAEEPPDEFDQQHYADRTEMQDERGRNQSRNNYPQDFAVEDNYPPPEVSENSNVETFVDKDRSHYCDAAVETDIDMTLHDRDKQNANDENQTLSDGKTNSLKPTKKSKMFCKCPPPPTKSKSTKPLGPYVKQRSASMKRHQKLEEDLGNIDFQAYSGYKVTRLHRAEQPISYKRHLYRPTSGHENNQSQHQKPLSQSNGGISVLGTFQVPQILAEKTISIVQNHISNMAPQLEEKPARKPISKELPAVSPNSSTETPANVPRNLFRNIDFDASKGRIIVLHPPVEDFRPSKYSFDVEESQAEKTTSSLPSKPT